MSEIFDPIDIVYQTLINDEALMELVGEGGSLFKYHIPEENREHPPLIRISPISELPTEYADNDQLAWDIIVQVDVWCFTKAREIALRINELMKTINLQQSTPTFEYDPDTYLIRDGRRYRGKILI